MSMCRTAMGWLALTAVVLAICPAVTRAADEASAGPASLAVLGNDSLLRAYFACRTPVVISPDGRVTVLADPRSKESKPMAAFLSPLPPADWTGPAFNDSTWERRRAPVEPEQPRAYTLGKLVAAYAAVSNSQICLRGKFMVDAPARAHDLHVSLVYVGGAAVYVNGQEVTRRHLPEGPLGADTLAEKYPDNLYVEPDGMFLQDVKKNPSGFDRRYRRLTDVAIPSNLLRKGVNVLAVALYRAPVNEAAVKAKRAGVGGMRVVPGLWSYVELRSLSLTAGAGSAVTPAVTRPEGIEVWNCAPFETVGAYDWGDAGGPFPVALPAARNGVFSARLMVTSDQAIKGLQAVMSDLTLGQVSGAIPAPGVRVRYAAPASADKSWAPPYRFDALLDTIPTEIPVTDAPAPREAYLRNPAYRGQAIKRPDLKPGAVASLWLTVRVPKDAKAGTYAGTITVSADGLPPTAVPFTVTVADWTVPDPMDFRVHNLSQSSPDNLARYYGVPLWSDRHFHLMGRSMALMAEAGSRQVIVNLAIDFYGLAGNSESMIRWIRQADGAYTHDFSIFDKFLDLTAKSVGKPLHLRLNCWPEVRPGWKTGDAAKKVTRLDPATGKCEPMQQPTPGTPESLAFWKPVLDEVRKNVEARGWYDVTTVGHNSYNGYPNPKIVSVFKQIWADGAWSYTAHNGTLNMRFKAAEKGISMPVKDSSCVWTRGRLTVRGYRALLKPRASIWCWTNRGVMRDWSDLTLVRDVPEGEIMRGQDGVSDFGADFFPIKGPRRRFTCVGNGRGTGGPNNSTRAMLAPGPDGPVATERFEMLREGVQLSEAVLFIERALMKKEIAGDLAQRCEQYLNDRSTAYMWRWSSARLERDARLLALAAQVTAAVGDR